MAKPTASSGWDPVLIISQILSLQTLHYLTLAILIPPLLSLFAEPSSLEYEGGATNVGMPVSCRTHCWLTCTLCRIRRYDNGLATDGWSSDVYIAGSVGDVEQRVEWREASWGRRRRE